MSLPLLTLRPPPNVDFVTGFAGLAPGLPHRPHAAVTGTLEVRSPQPLKVKWVRVELRKIESVPGQAPFIDTVGNKPTTLWEAQGSEFGNLQSADFPFAIRIPESIPPTISVDNHRARVEYEITATLCSKGKKGLLRRETSPVSTASHKIPIYKHELHPLWPVYAQPDERQITKDGMTLSVSRKRMCLGSGGDTIPIHATLFTDFPISLRSFELVLRQTIKYPHGGNTVGKKGPPAPPPSRTAIISEQKIPYAVRIQPGMHQTCELTCMLPPNYSEMTVTTARLVENEYDVQVSANLEPEGFIVVSLPLIVSPFPIPYTMDMMQRMGPPPMALDHPSRAHLHRQGESMSRPASAAGSLMTGHSKPDAATSMNGHPPTRQQKPYSIAERVGGLSARDESLLGGPESPMDQSIAHAATIVANGHNVPRSAMTNAYPMEIRNSTYNDVGQPGIQPQMHPTSPPPAEAPMPVSPPTNTFPPRFAVVNADQRDDPESPRSSALHEPYITAAEEKRRIAQQMREAETYADVPPPGAPPSNPIAPVATSPPRNPVPVATSPIQSTPTTQNSGDARKQWLSAEEEKQKLYQKAKVAAELTQRKAVNSQASSSSATKSSPKAGQFTESQTYNSPAGGSQGSQPTSASPGSMSSPNSSQKPKDSKWLSAEEEKTRLYEKAQAKALRTQRAAAANNISRSDSVASNNGPNGPLAASSTSKGADMYKAAMSSIKSPTVTPPAVSPSKPQQTPPPREITPSISPAPVPVPVVVPRTVTPPPPPPPASNGQWLTAEDEKARLRYLEAKSAVERHVAMQDEDYGAGSSFQDQGGSYGNAAYASYAPPSSQAPWNAPPTSPPPMNNGYSVSSTPKIPSAQEITPLHTGVPHPEDPPAFEPSFGYTYGNSASEKEKMRLMEEEKARQTNGPPAPDYGNAPPPDFDYNPAGSSSLPNYGSPAPALTASEEKARLREQFAAQENTASTPSPSIYSRPTPEIPLAVDGSRMLTAVEEKARLKAMQAAERPVSSVAPLPPPRFKSPPPSAASGFSRTNTNSSYISTSGGSSPHEDLMKRDPSIAQGKQRALTPSNASVMTASSVISSTPPPPPPLAPRPPRDYIEKTREEDAKIRRMTQETINMSAYGSRDSTLAPWQIPQGTGGSPGGDFALGLRPFSPFDMSLDASGAPQNGQGQSLSPTAAGSMRSSYYR